ncbi:MAG: sigma 54-dependent Fis family transcriptional regulator [Myxococcales bacterium]|nr:sigma 54-dependent Fis family transcriptional regulator [Myxococcales bacterium]
MGTRDDAGTRTLTILNGHTGEGTERQLSVEVVAGPDRRLARVFPESQVVVGSGPECDLVLSDPTVSRRHTEFIAVEGGVRVVDLGSKNGTRVMGAQVQEALLPGVSHVELGGTQLRVSSVSRELGTGERLDRFGDYLTASPRLGAVLAQLKRASASKATVLLEGETGTGKELLARAIHEASPRATGPFVVVDCGAVTSSLLESQLFGHVKGAFTGATEDRVGAFEAATGGTVFLDELGELPLDLQPKLLRALEARTIRRVGEVTDRKIDARFVAATHRDLEGMVAQGTFRADLFYRVAVVRVRVPPLRERPEDVPRLAAHYVADLSDGHSELSPEAYAALAVYDWPGNARELRNVVERALALAEGPKVDPEALFGVSATPAASFHEAKDQLLLAFEDRYVTALLQRHKGNVSHAAKEAGLSRNALYALMKRVGYKG